VYRRYSPGPLNELWSVPFEQVKPVRTFPSFRGQKSFPGLYFAATMDAHVGFESWVERDVAMMLDFDPNVVGFSSQAFWLTWTQAGEEHRHAPDYFARLADGSGTVIDVRTDGRIDAPDAEALAAAALACEEVGWVFQRIAAPEATLAANVRWLAGYRHARCFRGDTAETLSRVFASPTPLLTGASLAGDPMAVLPVLYHLLWNHTLAVELSNSLLGPASLVSVHQKRPVRFDGRAQTVVGLSGTLVRLATHDGHASVVQLAHLLAGEGFEVIGGTASRRRPLSASALEGLRGDAADSALRWERHIVEVLTGADPEAPPGAPRPGYDPARYSLAQREETKATELAAAGEKVTARTVKRKRQRYETQGLAGLIDRRADRTTKASGRTDERVLEALQQAISEQSARSTKSASFYLWRTREILASQYGSDAVPMPARATFYRLFERVTAGQHTTGSARTRQSLANRPHRTFRQTTAGRPGEIVEIDSTPLDVMVMLDDGIPGRVELTGMIDLATRTITAAVLRPTAKSVDASLLLARTVTPEPMRPGWAEALSMARSVLPHARLLELDQRLQHAAARPVIVPETIVCEHGLA